MRYFLSVLAWLIGYVSGYFVTWIGLLFCKEQDEFMPKLFWLWDNPDGINGTVRGNNPIWPRICGSEKATRTFRNRWIWITFRNPVSNLSRLLGRRTGAVQSRKVRTGVFLDCPWVYESLMAYDAARGAPVPLRQFSMLYGKDHGRKLWIRLGWSLLALDQDTGVAKLLFRFTPGKKVAK